MTILTSASSETAGLVERLLALRPVIDNAASTISELEAYIANSVEATLRIRAEKERDQEHEALQLSVQRRVHLTAELSEAKNHIEAALQDHYDDFREEQPTTVGVRPCKHADNPEHPDFGWIARARSWLSSQEGEKSGDSPELLPIWQKDGCPNFRTFGACPRHPKPTDIPSKESCERCNDSRVVTSTTSLAGYDYDPCPSCQSSGKRER